MECYGCSVFFPGILFYCIVTSFRQVFLIASTIPIKQIKEGLVLEEASLYIAETTLDFNNSRRRENVKKGKKIGLGFSVPLFVWDPWT